MFTVLFLIVPLVLKSSGQPCEDKNSIDVSGGKVFSDGTVFKDGVAFPPKLVYSKNVSGEIRSFGCVCELKTCLRKCCPLGSVMYKRSCTKMEDEDILLKSGVDLYFQNAFQRRVKLDTAEDLFVIHDRPCKKMYLEDDGHWFLQEITEEDYICKSCNELFMRRINQELTSCDVAQASGLSQPNRRTQFLIILQKSKDR